MRPHWLCRLLAFALFAAVEAPDAQIATPLLKAHLYLPDAARGYYRGTRFDWSGQIASLEWNGHNFFGQWFPRYDPKLHDAIMGPVEEFLTNDAGLGYAEARPGETFVKIGVGAVRKPDEPAFRQFSTYEITNPGTWSIRRHPDSVEFTQTIPETLGYAYTYTKTVRLAANKPELILEHRLRNTGKKTIDSTVYEHNFYMLDGLPTGPDVVVKFAFPAKAAADLKGMAEVRGNELVYLKELPQGQSAATDILGFGNTAKDYDIRVENRKAGIGVRQTSDRPLARIHFWSIRTTACPEAYIDMHIEPGKEFTWRIAYDFYKLP